MKKLVRLCLLVLLFSCLSLQAKQPNIILIMADDIGVEGIGSYGGLSYKTPQIDKLANQGMRFTHAYAQPLCTNTRIQLMTGLYNHRNWVAFGIMDPEAKTIGHYMQDAGYTTCMSGKWQLHSYDPPDYPGAGLRRGRGMKVEDSGFDEHCMWHTLHTEDKGSRYANPEIFENGRRVPETEGKYGPDLFTDFINGFLEKQKGSKKPFFVYYPMALPHWPMVPTPDSEEWKEPSRRLEEDTRYFKDMVEYMDKCVGRIVKKVDSLGMGEDTLILFYSDNGTHLKITSKTVAGPVAGGKGRPTDAGTHVPLIARWTGTIKQGLNEDIVDSADFIPTVMEAAGKPLPKSHKLDGVSFFKALTGKNPNPKQYFYCFYDPRPGWDKDQFSRHVFIRDKQFKLYEDGRLYDAEGDKLEKNILLAYSDDKARRSARRKLTRLLKEITGDK